MFSYSYHVKMSRYHVCLTVLFVPGEGATRSPEWLFWPSAKVWYRKIFVNGELNFNITTKYLPEVNASNNRLREKGLLGGLGGWSTDISGRSSKWPKQCFSIAGPSDRCAGETNHDEWLSKGVVILPWTGILKNFDRGRSCRIHKL